MKLAVTAIVSKCAYNKWNFNTFAPNEVSIGSRSIVHSQGRRAPRRVCDKANPPTPWGHGVLEQRKVCIAITGGFNLPGAKVLPVKSPYKPVYKGILLAGILS